MSSRHRPRAWLLVIGAVLGAACGGGTTPIALERSAMRASAATRPATPDQQAIAAGRRFLDRYLADDGRIVRRDQGGDTVSEGQAYGMLVAVALSDRTRFDAIWNWTRTNLQRSDHLLSWRWDHGRVADSMPATDADVDAAHALVLAATRFHDPSYASAALAMAAGVVDHEVVAGTAGAVAVAGPWAVDGRWVNPSYADPVADAALAALTGDATWNELDDAARRIAIGSRNGTDLAPDWAVLEPESIRAHGPPSGGPARHGYDAARVAIRFAIDCDPTGRAIAADMVDEYRDAEVAGGVPAAVISLDGRPTVDHGHPVMTVAFAAATEANGDRAGAADLLDRAEAQADAAPGYYGDAWVALGRLWLTTPRLDGCAPR